jgi:hypothetical protein
MSRRRRASRNDDDARRNSSERPFNDLSRAPRFNGSARPTLTVPRANGVRRYKTRKK